MDTKAFFLFYKFDKHLHQEQGQLTGALISPLQWGSKLSNPRGGFHLKAKRLCCLDVQVSGEG